MVPPAIWLPIRRSPPMSAVKHRVHRRRRQLLLLTVVTNPRRHRQQCHSPYQAFPTSSPIPQVRKVSRTYLRPTPNSKIMWRPSDREWNVLLKATIKIVALFAGLLASGYRSHLILTIFANVLWICDPSNFTHHVPWDSFAGSLSLLFYLTLFYLLKSLYNNTQPKIHPNIYKSCVWLHSCQGSCMYTQQKLAIWSSIIAKLIQL